MEAGDTASACLDLAKSGRKDTAAIANYEVAQMHKLEILQEGISTDINNQTRFVVITKDSNQQDDIVGGHQTKTTIAFALKNVSGSLFKALSVFALRDINILQILTRPSTCASDLLPDKFHWEFIVVIDIQGAKSDENVKNALRSLEEFTISCRVFGSYVSAPDQKLRAQQRFDHVLSILQTNPH